MPFEYTYNDANRLVKCKCCETLIPISDSITREGLTFCRDSARCIWHQKGNSIEVEELPPDQQFKKPLFGD